MPLATPERNVLNYAVALNGLGELFRGLRDDTSVTFSQGGTVRGLVVGGGGAGGGESIGSIRREFGDNPQAWESLCSDEFSF